jgi:hypothetical protein
MQIDNPVRIIPKNLGIAFIEGLQTALDGKADDSDINNLAVIVAAKANQAAIDNLADAIAQKIDKTLTENTTVSSNDFLVIETASGVNRKVKVALVKGSSSTSVITSSTEPPNAVEGLIWNELDSNGYLLETWIRNTFRWVSGLKQYTGGSGSVAGNFQEYLPLDNSKDILIRNFSLLLNNTGTASYSGTATLSIDLGVVIKISNFNTTGIAAGSKASYIYSLNNLYSPATNDSLFVQIVKSGTGTGNVLSGYKISYRDIRR